MASHLYRARASAMIMLSQTSRWISGEPRNNVLKLECQLNIELEPGNLAEHDDVIKWKHFPRYWPFVRGIHWSLVIFPHNGQWRRVLMFSLICAWTNAWVNNRDAGDLRPYCPHFYVFVMSNVLYLLHTTVQKAEYCIACEQKCFSLWTLLSYLKVEPDLSQPKITALSNPNILQDMVFQRITTTKSKLNNYINQRRRTIIVFVIRTL